MKKLFVSVPMRGRKEEDIKKSYEIGKRIAEAVWGEELELIETFVKSDPPATNNIAIYMLGESIKKMAAADYFVGPSTYLIGGKSYNGCFIESVVAKDYKLKDYEIDYKILCPDLVKKKNE